MPTMKEVCCSACKRKFKVNNLSVKYCSHECRKIGQQRSNKKNYVLNKESENMNPCQYCGCVFNAGKCQDKFCSPNCREMHKNARINSSWTQRTPEDEKNRVKKFRKNRITLDWCGRTRYAISQR